jgi:DNA polymerase-3 subunit alpha (Gram-positive type)
MNSYVAIDLETTGVNPTLNNIIELGAVKINNGNIIDTYSKLINPECIIPKEIEELTGITNKLVQNEPTVDKVLKDFIEFCDGLVLIGHNIIFDYSFIKVNANKLNYKFEKNGIDTFKLSKALLKNVERRSLTYLCNYFHIHQENCHRAYDDALASYELFKVLKYNYYSEVNKKLFEPKKLAWKAKKQQSITPRQKRYLLDLIATHKLTYVQPIDNLSKSQASREIDKIIYEYGNIS